MTRHRSDSARVAFALTALALLVAVPVSDASTPWQTGVVVDDAPRMATAWNTQRKLVRDDAGTLHAVVLAEEGDRASARVRVLRSEDAGASWEALPPPPGENATLRPTLALAPDALWLAWTEYLPAEKHHQVFVAPFRDGAWQDVTRLSHTRGYSGYPSLAVSEDGRHLHAAWYGFDQGYYQVFHRVRAPDGSWSEPVRLSVGIPDAVNPTLTVGPDGALNVAWYKQEARHYQVWFTRRAPDGTWSSPVTVSSGSAHSMNPTVVVDDANVVHVAWDRAVTENDTETRTLWLASAQAGRFHADTASPLRVDGAPADSASFPTLATHPDGGLALAWTAPDGIRVARGNASHDFTSLATLGSPGARDANLRWQAHHQPDAPLELVFTENVGEDAYRAVHARTGAAAPGAGSDGADTPAPGAVIVVLLLAACAHGFTRPRSKE